MGSCADPCDRASTLNEPNMQVDVIDLACIFLVDGAREARPNYFDFDRAAGHQCQCN